MPLPYGVMIKQQIPASLLPISLFWSSFPIDSLPRYVTVVCSVRSYHRLTQIETQMQHSNINLIYVLYGV